MSTTLEQPQANLISTDKSNIDLRIDKKEFDIFTEDGSCIIDEVEFVKIIDLETNMSLPVVDTPQATANATPRKGIHKFVSRMFNRMAVLPLTLPLCLVLVLGVGNVLGQTTIYSTNFGTTAVTSSSTFVAGWTSPNYQTGGTAPKNMSISTSSASGTYSTPITASGGANLADGSSSPSSGTATATLAGQVNTTGYTTIELAFGYRASSTSYTATVTLDWSPDGSTWNSVSLGTLTRDGSWRAINGSNWLSLPSGAENQSNLRFRFTFVRANTSGNFRIDDFTVRGTASPTISTSGTLSAVNTTYGTASASPTSFTVSGSNLNGTTAVTVTPPAGFEVATSSDFSTTIGTSASALSLGTATSIASTTIYVRLAATASVSGSPYSGNIVVAGGGATSQNVATVSSTVSKKALTITAGNQSVVYGTAVATITGNGSYTPTGFVNSETSSVIGGSATFTTTYTTTTNAGSDVATITPVTTSLTATNYSFTAANGNISVTAIVPSAPSITGITPANTQLSVAFSAPSSNGGASITNYEYSINGGGNWTTPSPAVTTSPFTISGLTNGSTYDVQIRAVNSAGSGTATGTTQGTPAAPSSPTISGAATATAFTTTYGTASAPQSFSVSGSALTGDITATAPTGFVVSSDGSSYNSTATFTQSGGSASGTLYIKLAATATVSGTYNSQNIVLSSTGASSVNVTTATSGNSVSAKGLTITGISISNKTYDAITTATISGTAAYSGLVNGETFSVTGTPNATFTDKNVANGKSVTLVDYTAPSGNYSISQPTGLTANITAATLTLTGASVTSKTYDGTTAATITGTISGVISSDVVTLNGTGTFASANVGTGISVTSTSTLGGADAGNYSLTQPTGLTGNITGASQTITFASLTPVTLSTADYSPGATASSGLTVTYTSSNPCVATIVSGNIHIVGAGTTTITASQSGGGNYSAATSVNQTLTVMNPISTLSAGDVALVAINSANPDKFSMVFLKDVAQNVAINFTDNGFTATTTTRTGEGFLTYTVPSGGHAAGTVITWTNAMNITGTGWSSNAPTNMSFNGGGDQLFVFSGNTANWSTLSGITLLYGLNYGIALSATSSASNTVQPSTTLLPATSWLNLGTSSYANTYFANATTSSSSVSVSDLASTLLSYFVDGANKWYASSSTAATFPSYSITVSPSPLITTSGTLSAVNTTYGTASASPTSFSVSSSNLTTDLTLTAPSGFEISSGSGYSTSLTISPDACGAIASTSIDVRLAASTAVGTYSGNIALSSTGATTVNVATVSSAVSTKTLTITNLSASDKLYNGLTTVTVSGTPAYSGLVNSESFSVSGTVSWAFPNASVENNKVLTRTGNYAAPSANYTVTQPSLTASITTRSLTITANNVNKAYGDVLTGGSGSTAFTSSGLQNSETIGSLTISYGNGALAGDAVGTYTNQVTPSSATGGTFTASNYSISYVSANIVVSDVPTLNPVTLTSALSTTYGTASTGVSFTASGANLSANITATAQSGYQVSDDNITYGSSVSISSGTTVYVRFTVTQAAGSYNNATAVVLSSTGATSQNVTTSSSSNTVSQKGLTITGISISSKTYDATTTATISGTAAYSGLVNGESFAVSGTPSAVFNNKNVGTAKPISVSGYTAPSVNYSITQPTGLTADITSKSLTVTSAAVITKTYDGTTAATITETLSGVISPDVVTLVGTGTFASANVGTGIVVTSNSTLGGSESGNYSLTQPTGLTGEITKANQTITFGALVNKTTNDTPFNLTATASSGLTVSYTSSNTSVATIVGNTVTIVGVGTTTITASQSGNSNFNAASDVTQTLTVTLADIEEIIFPEYIQGVNGTNANRIPSSYYLKVNNLSPNTTYRFYCGFVTASDLSTSSGAGNNIYVNYAGGSFTRSSSPSLATVGNYSTLTTNSTGSYTGWFVMEPTGNATRFVPGTNLYLRVSLNDGNNGTTVVNYRTSSNTSKVINLVASAGSNNGTGLYGISSAASKNFVVLFDNTAGTGRPISTSFIEADGTANTTANSYSSFYNTNVNEVSGAYGVVIPNNNVNGIKRIEFKKTSDNSLIYSVTDNDGNWSGTANTVNPTGGTTAISIPNTTFDDATYNETSGISLLQNTKINGTITLSQGTLNVGPYELTLNGSISRTSGNIDASNASATVVFSGSSAQTIPASTFTGSINNLTLNNSAGLTTNQALTVANTLNLVSGILTLGSNNLTLTGSLDATNNGSSTAFINTNSAGAFIRSTSSTGFDYKFPVGLSDYAPISVNFTGGTIASSTLASRAVGGLHPEAADGAYIRSNLYWEMNQSGMTNPQYNVSFTYPGVTNGAGSSDTEANLLPAKWSASTGWLSSGSCAVCFSGSTMGTSSLNTSTKTITWNGVSGFSDFGGFGQGNGSPLPVELLSFNASCIENQNILSWQTASEQNSSHFDIEKSIDGEIWNVIGKKEAAGNSNELLTYQFVDAEKNNATIYYRLNQVDFDGKSEYFGPATTDCDASNFEASTLPNPSNGNFWVKIQSNEASSAVLCIVDVKGNNLFSNEIIVQEGINLYQINSFLDTGIYFIHICNSKDQKTTILKHLQN